MNPQDIATLKAAAAGLEASLDAIEAWLEDSNDRSVYQAGKSMETALRHLYAAEPKILNAVSCGRVEEALSAEKAKAKAGDRFNTGF